MRNLLITLFMTFSVCYAANNTTGNGTSQVIINGTPDPIPTVTQVSIIPIGPTGGNSSNVTTAAPNTTTTAPTTTTVSPTTKPTTTISTTIKPNSTTTASTTTTPTTQSTPSTTTTKNGTTISTTNPTKATTSVSPPAPTVAPTPSSNRKFDGPSFVGGIVLASGLMAIGFVAFKFYKARTELNYHTL